MIKKILRIIFWLLLFSLIVLITIKITNSTKTTNEMKDKIQITSTIFPYYSISNEICNASAKNIMLLKPGMETHTFEPTTEDIISIKNSDIFIYTGGESDKWVETILSSIDKDKTKIIKLTDYIKPIIDHHNQVADEHIWTSLKNTRKIVQIVSNAICETNPQLSTEYKNNTNKLLNKIDNLDKQFEETIKASAKTVIFADRFPFTYFAKDYNLNYIPAFPSCAEESEPTIQSITNIISKIKEENIKIIFYIEFSNQKIADAIANETGVSKLLFHSCHNVTKEDFDNGVSYVTLMHQNLNNLKEALK